MFPTIIEAAFAVLIFGLPALCRSHSANYDPSWSYRPANASSTIYNWVGSYYNGTTTITFHPYAGLSENELVDQSTTYCSNLAGLHTIGEFNTTLAITEPADKTPPLDGVWNPIDFYLNIWALASDTKSSSYAHTEFGVPPKAWVIQSSSIFNGYDESPDKEIDISVNRTSGAPYNATGVVGDSYRDSWLYFKMDDCNNTSSERNWTGRLLNRKAWSKLNGGSYDWTYPDPTINLEFDSKSANMSMGTYTRAVIVSLTVDERVVHVSGYINVTFRGVVDSLRSDVMVNDSDTPAWLRSVGFNNNSLNIQYEKNIAMNSKSEWGLGMAFSAFLLAPLAFYI